MENLNLFEFLQVDTGNPYTGKITYVYKDENGTIQKPKARKVYDFFRTDPEDHFIKQCDALLKGEKLHSGEIGWLLEKPLPKFRDMTWQGLFWESGPKVYIIRPEVKKAIEQANLSSTYFFPMWLNEVGDKDNPDYWGFVTTNGLREKNITLSLQGKPPYPIHYLPKGSMHKLTDFGTLLLNPDGIRFQFVYPDIISQKAYQVLKQFKGIKFKPVEFV